MRTTGAAALLLALLAMWGCGNSQVRAEYTAAAKHLPAELASAKAEGIPMDPSDLARTVPEGKNAASNYYTASEAAGKKHPELVPSVLPTNDEITEARTSIEKYAPVLAALEKATAKPHLYFARDYSRGAAVTFPELGDLKWFAKLLVTRARVEAFDGRYSAAVNDLLRAKRISEHVAEEPTVIATLVAIAIDSIVLKGIRNALTDSHGAIDFVKALDTGFADKGTPFNLTAALRGESVMGVASLQYVNKDDVKRVLGMGDSPAVELVPSGVDIGIVRNAYKARLLEAQRQIFSIVKNKPVTHATGTELDKLANSWQTKDASYNFNKVLFPVYGQLCDAIVRNEMLWMCTHAGLKVLLHKGDFPASLNDIGITDKDAFGKGPLQFKVTKERFYIYSVGPNGADDGGVEMRDQGRDDIAFAYPEARPKPPPFKKP